MDREKRLTMPRELRPWERALLESCDLYLVGGTVRDYLRGAAIDSVDEDYIAAGIALDDLSRELGRFGAINLVGKSFGVIKFTPSGARTVDISLPRTEFSTGPAHRDFRVRFDPALPIERDLDRRDFTVNSMALHVGTGLLVDPLGGKRDLARRLLRVNRDDSFREDPLRILRGVQFMARFGFAVEEGTLEQMRRDRALLATVSAERVRDEFTKLMLLAERPSAGFIFMHGEGILAQLVPELDRTYGESQNEFHPDDVFMHSVRSCDMAPADLALRWAALLHDVGKKDRKQVIGGRTVFYRHEEESERAADRVLGRLRYPREIQERVGLLIRHHMFNMTEEWSDAAVRRFIARIEPENMEDLLALREADALSRGDRSVLAQNEAIRERFHRIVESDAALKVQDLAVDGHDVMDLLGLEPGPKVGEVLAKLLDSVIEDPAGNTRERLLESIREMGKKN